MMNGDKGLFLKLYFLFLLLPLLKVNVPLVLSGVIAENNKVFLSWL